MAKNKAAAKENKSDFVRRLLRENTSLTFDQVRLRWAAAGRAGAISSALYDRMRADVAIQLMEERDRARNLEKFAPVPLPRPPVVIYQFKITLVDVLPLVWRRVQVENCTLEILHGYIQSAMGWADAHPHHFVIDSILYGCYTVLGSTFTERRYWRTSGTHLSDFLPKDGSRIRFEYEYDFESSWRHAILFEGCPPAAENHRYPLCVEGARACPPEDVGGPAGYANFLQVIADRNDPRHVETRQWVGRPFDPEVFDPKAATREMSYSKYTFGFLHRRR